jgi:hypothetical protein
MGKEYTQEEMEEVVKGVESCYEQIFQEGLAKRFFQLRVQSHYCAYLNLKMHGLDLFDADGKVTREKLIGADLEKHQHTHEVDEFGTIYFLPLDSGQLLDGEAIIQRLLYYYFVKDRMDRYKLMRQMLADYRNRFREGEGVNTDTAPGNAHHL